MVCSWAIIQHAIPDYNILLWFMLPLARHFNTFHSLLIGDRGDTFPCLQSYLLLCECLWELFVSTFASFLFLFYFFCLLMCSYLWLPIVGLQLSERSLPRCFYHRWGGSGALGKTPSAAESLSLNAVPSKIIKVAGSVPLIFVIYWQLGCSSKY